MNRLLFVIVILVLCSSSSAQGQLPQSQFSRDTVGKLDPDLFGGKLAMSDYTGKEMAIEGIQADLNVDGKTDVIQLISINCGTGGCSFYIYDGAIANRIGEFFGSRFFISQTKINGWPVLEGYHHMSSGSGMFTIYVFDGIQYVKASSVYLYGESANELFKHYEAVPKLLR